MSRAAAFAIVACTACGYPVLPQLGGSDAAGDSNGDASGMPPVPHIGAQIDRMGRPLVNQGLDHTYDTVAMTRNAARDAYNQDGSAAMWPPTYTPAFAKSLGIWDAIDAGLSCVNGTCTTGGGNGCATQLLYNGNVGGGGSPTATSYNTLANLLADDELYLDTKFATCTTYLAVEAGVVFGTGATSCGGRTPTYDVVDVTYTLLSMGLSGFDAAFTPAFGDNVGAHADVSLTNFPFLGAPH